MIFSLFRKRLMLGGSKKFFLLWLRDVQFLWMFHQVCTDVTWKHIHDLGKYMLNTVKLLGKFLKTYWHITMISYDKLYVILLLNMNEYDIYFHIFSMWHSLLTVINHFGMTVMTHLRCVIPASRACWSAPWRRFHRRRRRTWGDSSLSNWSKQRGHGSKQKKTVFVYVYMIKAYQTLSLSQSCLIHLMISIWWCFFWCWWSWNSIKYHKNMIKLILISTKFNTDWPRTKHVVDTVGSLISDISGRAWSGGQCSNRGGKICWILGSLFKFSKTILIGSIGIGIENNCQ